MENKWISNRVARNIWMALTKEEQSHLTIKDVRQILIMLSTKVTSSDRQFFKRWVKAVLAAEHRYKSTHDELMMVIC